MEEKLSAQLATFLADSEKISRREFDELVRKIIAFIDQTKEITEKELVAIQRAIETLRAEIKQENTGALDTMQSKVDQVFVGDRLQEMGGKIDMSLNELKQTISKIVDRKISD